jgi:dTDP-4-amino-4,6-dideoxygalactose transaminase
MTTQAGQNARPYLHGTEHDAVRDALEAGQYGHGPITETFEEGVARFLGVPDVIATASGTAALHIALLAAGVGPGDEVIVPSLTFAATVQVIIAVGASPRFIEVNPETLCVEARDVFDALGPRTRAVMPVLYGGRAVDLREIQDTLDTRGVVVIEDAAQAFGSHLGDRLVGANRRVVTCFSFGPIKNLSTIEGGAVIPRTGQDAETVRRLRILGITQPQAERIRTTTYEVAGFGLRATMSSVHAAFGLAQLQRFPKVAARRQELWRTYRQALDGLRNVCLVDVDSAHTVPFNCVVRVPRRDEVFAFMCDHGVGVGVHYPPNHAQPAFAQWHRPLPATERLGQEILSLPFHPAMNEEDVDTVVSMLRSALTRR